MVRCAVGRTDDLKVETSHDEKVQAESKRRRLSPRAVDRYQTLGDLVLGHTERVDNLHYFLF